MEAGINPSANSIAHVVGAIIRNIQLNHAREKKLISTQNPIKILNLTIDVI